MEFTISINSGNFDQYEQVLKKFKLSKDEGKPTSIHLRNLIDLMNLKKEISKITQNQTEIIISDSIDDNEIDNHIHIRDIQKWPPNSRGYK